MANTEIFDFPVVVTKYELQTMYGVNCAKLKEFLGDELAKEIGWQTKRTFKPEETRKIFEALSTTRYKEFVARKKALLDQIILQNIKQAA